MEFERDYENLLIKIILTIFDQYIFLYFHVKR